MNILLMANWGIGLEILKALHGHRDVGHLITITRYRPESDDPWENVLYKHSLELGHETLPENNVTFKEIVKTIHLHDIDLMITHAFMKILPGYIFSAPKLGTMNIHPSLLPKYRGPSPTQWVLKNQETETGLTAHYIDNGVDTGDIIHQVKISIDKSDTVGSIIEKGKKQVQDLIGQSLLKIQDPFFIPEKQPGKSISSALEPVRNETTRI